MNRFRLVAWFVSHCQAPSGRDEYVAKLKKIVPIDIYGKCSGNLSLEYGSTDESFIISQSKFYIAFENSICPEYVTEKLYKIINRNIEHNPPVPIVMGANKSWYEENLPRKSFIHVDDFHGPEELGRYLKELHSDRNKFLEYLQWRKYYKRVCKPPVRCKLCDLLVKNNFKQQKKILISDFESFWKRANCKK